MMEGGGGGENLTIIGLIDHCENSTLSIYGEWEMQHPGWWSLDSDSAIDIDTDLQLSNSSSFIIIKSKCCQNEQTTHFSHQPHHKNTQNYNNLRFSFFFFHSPSRPA